MKGSNRPWLSLADRAGRIIPLSPRDLPMVLGKAVARVTFERLPQERAEHQVNDNGLLITFSAWGQPRPQQQAA